MRVCQWRMAAEAWLPWPPSSGAREHTQPPAQPTPAAAARCTQAECISVRSALAQGKDAEAFKAAQLVRRGAVCLAQQGCSSLARWRAASAPRPAAADEQAR